MSFPDVENTTLSPLSLYTRIKYTERENRIRFIRAIFILRKNAHFDDAE